MFKCCVLGIVRDYSYSRLLLFEFLSNQLLSYVTVMLHFFNLVNVMGPFLPKLHTSTHPQICNKFRGLILLHVVQGHYPWMLNVP